MPLLLVSDALVRRSISVEECNEAVESGFRLVARGDVGDAYGGLSYNGETSIKLYAAHVPRVGVGAKILGLYADNPAKGKPYIRAVVTLLDPDTGELEAVVDATYLTALRTGAATAIAARELGRRNGEVLGILGTGLHARTHLLCHLAAHAFQRVLVWGRNAGRVREYLTEMRSKVDVPLDSMHDADTVCAEADVIACTTSSEAPLFRAEAVRAGTHIGVAAPMGSHYSEIPLELLGRSHLFVDTRKKFREHWEPGDHPAVEAELGEVLVGSAKGRITAEDVTIFKPEGMAFEDVVSARIVVDRVSREGSGQTVDW